MMYIIPFNKIAQAYSQYVKKMNVPFVFEGVESPSSNGGYRMFSKNNILYLKEEFFSKEKNRNVVRMTESKIKQIVAEVVEKVLNLSGRIPENRDAGYNVVTLYEGKQKSAYSSGAYLSAAIKKNGNVLFSQLNEGIDFQPSANERGGIIVFSTDVNAVQMDEQEVIDFLKQKMQTISNRINSTKKIDRIAKSNNLIGWTIGKYLNGRYTAENGKQYGENSLSLEIIGVSCETRIKIAEELCTSFVQESVLVKDYSSGSIMFVKPLIGKF